VSTKSAPEQFNCFDNKDNLEQRMIRMVSAELFDTEDWGKNAENSALPLQE